MSNATRIGPLRRREPRDEQQFANDFADFMHTEPEAAGMRSESVGADFETHEPASLPTPLFRLFLVAVAIVVVLAALVIYRSAR